MKTEEEKIKAIEEKVRLTNITDYVNKTDKKYAIKGTITGTVLAAIPLSINAAANFLGIDPNPLDPNALVRLTAGAFDYFENLFPTILTTALLISASGYSASKKKEEKIEEMMKMKYFLDNKEYITKGCPDNINILDARDMDSIELVLYEEVGRTLVKKNTKTNSWYL